MAICLKISLPGSLVDIEIFITGVLPVDSLPPWEQVGWELRTLPSYIIKMSRPRWVYLSRQAKDVLVTLNNVYTHSESLHPGRFSPRLPLSALR